ncbi:transcription factor bHLH143-like isoform X1 [Prosopis cineraria]|uniref:transcription factor bHLH143-like isoform X1 n=1 Tax=Prosopis cineraria TaxID=364024 RepID=UPI0024103522|nr:transcription factor bHLH143-like isoform X1 [Prosopis cineraria]XP_054788807.1 transcription factor bHLH143-like isoform X1 [Prosopis cineraria]
MGEDCGTWVPQRRLDWQTPNLSSFRAPCEGKQTGVSAPGIDNMITSNEAMPAYASSVLPHLQLGHSNEPSLGWFYCLPQFGQSFMPAANLSVKGNLLAGQVKGFGGETVPNRETQKQFLVIDQTGYQTTFIYSPRLGSWPSKWYGPKNLNVNEPSFKTDANDLIGSSFPAEVDENQERDMESEMHEDTEEINALLYSDSDDYSTEDDEEVTSTGHSPSTLTTHDDSREIFRAATEEVGTSSGKSKKRKLSDSAYDDTATSLNLKRPNEYESGGDAESRCSGGKSQGSGEMGSLSGNKKMRREKIREVLSVLQSIIPGGKDKDPIVLLDEAICCLKSLKLKARTLGLDALLSS